MSMRRNFCAFLLGRSRLFNAGMHFNNPSQHLMTSPSTLPAFSPNRLAPTHRGIVTVSVLGERNSRRGDTGRAQRPAPKKRAERHHLPTSNWKGALDDDNTNRQNSVDNNQSLREDDDYSSTSADDSLDKLLMTKDERKRHADVIRGRKAIFVRQRQMQQMAPNDIEKEKPLGEKIVPKEIIDLDHDTFGNFDGRELDDEETAEDEDDFGVENVPRRREALWYANRALVLCKRGQVKEAIDLIEVRMRRVDCVRPLEETYTHVIGACGRLGYVEKAFELYRRMKGHGHDALNVAVITSLFNACAESADGQRSLEMARRLRETVQLAGFTFNQLHYHSMIKVFARHGDLTTAFQLVDEMCEQEIRCDEVTYQLMLSACLSDEKAGFTLAIKVWRRMRHLHYLPTLNNYVSLLKAARKCGAGSPEWTFSELFSSAQQVKLNAASREPLAESSASNALPQVSIGDSTTNTVLYGHDKTTDRAVVQHGKRSADALPAVLIPNVLNPRHARLKAVVALGPLERPDQRLALLGGVTGMISLMQRDKVKPDRRVFTEFLLSLPPTTDSETALLDIMRQSGCKPDVDYFNMLIKRRARRYDYAGVLDVLRMIGQHGLAPNEMTFGCVAIACRTRTTASELLSSMEQLDMEPNAIILGTLLANACAEHNPAFVMLAMSAVERFGIPLEKRAIWNISRFYEHIQRAISLSERLSPAKRRHFDQVAAESPASLTAQNLKEQRWIARVENETFRRNYNAFRRMLFQWLERQPVVDGKPDPFAALRRSAEEEQEMIAKADAPLVFPKGKPAWKVHRDNY